MAKKFADQGQKVTFAVSAASDFNHELSETGLTFNAEKGTPVVAARDAADQKYAMKDDFR